MVNLFSFYTIIYGDGKHYQRKFYILYFTSCVLSCFTDVRYLHIRLRWIGM